MMKLATRIIALLLAFFLTLGYLPGGAAAAENGEYTVIEPIYETFINPLYADVVDESELNQPGILLLSNDDTYYTSPEELALVLREAMCSRQETITVYYETTSNNFSKDVRKALSLAFDHTGVPGEGDNLLWQYAGAGCNVSGYSTGSTYYLTLVYTITYYTDAEQEAEVDEAVDALLEELDMDDMSNPQKIKTIYDWICANVTYDHQGLADDTDTLKYTTYGALIDKNCVCQGYSNLLYRLALECGIDCRIITGTSNKDNHAWNIVKLGNVYYNLDATWDAGQTPYTYFLKSDDNFPDHKRDNDYTTRDFCNAYPMAADNYSMDSSEEDWDPESCDHSYEAAVTAPTCTEGGYTTYTCTICSDSYVGDETDATGHSLGEWYQSKAPSATENGENRRDCANCDHFETEEVSNNPFTDIAQGKYYYNPVLWAYYNNITKGLNATTFGVNATCTREQVVTFLWSAAGRPEPETTENPFTDVIEGKFYYKAVLWAVEKGITKGTTATTFGVGEGCTRGQVVTFIWSYFGRPEPENTVNTFPDNVQGKYYYNAVLWAVENGVTSGYKDGTFQPGTICTREQIVTFLYRALVK